MTRWLPAPLLLALVAGCAEPVRPAAILTNDVPPIDAGPGTRPPDAAGPFDREPPPVDAAGCDGDCPARDAAPDGGPGDSTGVRSYPRGPYGTAVGSVLAPFQLTDCGNMAYFFDGPEFTRSSASVVVLATGWCNRCRSDAPLVEMELHRAYRERGVRVITVLVEGTTVTEPPSVEFCRAWTSTHGVSHRVLLDTTRSLSHLAPGGVFPTLYVVDDQGRIRGRWIGSDRGVREARAQLDAILGVGP